MIQPAEVPQLAQSHNGRRVDREGVMKKDFHTALEVARASKKKTESADQNNKPTEISDRWYLADASFLVGLESEDSALLIALVKALRQPVWQISLGRKSFVPAACQYASWRNLFHCHC